MAMCRYQSTGGLQNKSTGEIESKSTTNASECEVLILTAPTMGSLSREQKRPTDRPTEIQRTQVDDSDKYPVARVCGMGLKGIQKYYLV